MTFTEQNFIELCRDVRENTYVPTSENLVDQLRTAVREAAGVEPGVGLNPMEAERYSRMERQIFDIVRIIEARIDTKFDVLAVINKEIIGWAAQWKFGRG